LLALYFVIFPLLTISLCCPPPPPAHPHQGAKIGVLGANGAGKSSLMRILAGVDESFEGRVVRVPGIRVGYLEQEPELADGATVAENIEPAVKHIRWAWVFEGRGGGQEAKSVGIRSILFTIDGGNVSVKHIGWSFVGATLLPLGPSCPAPSGWLSSPALSLPPICPPAPPPPAPGRAPRRTRGSRQLEEEGEVVHKGSGHLFMRAAGR
jgi:energy-coupling factor transporter ATP-binding protein EcfA2